MTKLRRASFKGKRVIVSFKSQDAFADDEDEMSGWGYGYTDDGTGRGQENSPETFESKKQALVWAKKAKYYDVSE